ncbi:MAG: sodium:proton antiporter [Burkholderiaceae bacterium]
MFEIVASILGVAALCAFVNHRVLRLPPTVGVMAVSLAFALAPAGLGALGSAGGLQARVRLLVQSVDFSELLLQGMLSLLLFAGALHVDVDALRRHRWQVGALAFIGTAVSTVVVGGALFAVLPFTGAAVPLRECMLFGALISPTDPIAVIAILKSAGAPRSLDVVMAGESLFNDGVGVVLFLLLLDLLVDGGAPSAGRAATLLLRQAGGGLLLGAVAGAATSMLLRRSDLPVGMLLTLAVVVGGYAIANRLHVSGPLAMVAAGLVVGHGLRGEAFPADVRRSLGAFWALLDELLNALLFALVGMQVVVIRFPLGPLPSLAAGAAAILITLGARWLSTGLPVDLFRRSSGLPAGAGGVLTWGGLRGGISVALALALPAGPNRDLLIALAYGVVAFSILVQGSTFGWWVRRTLPRAE